MVTEDRRMKAQEIAEILSFSEGAGRMENLEIYKLCVQCRPAHRHRPKTHAKSQLRAKYTRLWAAIRDRIRTGTRLRRRALVLNFLNL